LLLGNGRGGAFTAELDLLAQQGNLVLDALHFRVNFVLALAPRHQVAVHLDALHAQLFQFRLAGGGVRGEFLVDVHCRGKPVAQVGHLAGEFVVLQPRVADFQLAQRLGQFTVANRRIHLALERAALALDLGDDVSQAQHVLLRRFELAHRHGLALLVLDDSGRLLEQETAVFRPGADDHVNLALADEGVGVGANARVHEQLKHVAQSARCLVDHVLAFAAAVEAARHLHLGIVDRKLRIGVVKGQRHFRHAGRGTAAAAVEYDVLHVVAAEGLGALLAQRPPQRVKDIALAATVRADDGGNPGLQIEGSPVRKGLESVQLYLFEVHAL